MAKKGFIQHSGVRADENKADAVHWRTLAFFHAVAAVPHTCGVKDLRP
jgi:hypothetical protein